jgi:hypothetical protein
MLYPFYELPPPTLLQEGAIAWRRGNQKGMLSSSTCCAALGVGGGEDLAATVLADEE